MSQFEAQITPDKLSSSYVGTWVTNFAPVSVIVDNLSCYWMKLDHADSPYIPPLTSGIVLTLSHATTIQKLTVGSPFASGLNPISGTSGSITLMFSDEQKAASPGTTYNPNGSVNQNASAVRYIGTTGASAAGVYKTMPVIPLPYERTILITPYGNGIPASCPIQVKGHTTNAIVYSGTPTSPGVLQVNIDGDLDSQWDVNVNNDGATPVIVVVHTTGLQQVNIDSTVPINVTTPIPSITQVILLPGIVRNTTNQSAIQTNPGYKGLQIQLNVTAVPGVQTVQLFVFADSVIGSTPYLHTAFTAIAAIGTYNYILYAGATVADYNAAFTATRGVPLPIRWGIQMVHSGAGNFTYSVVTQYIP